MDEVMLAALLAVVGVGAGAALGASGIWLGEVLPLRQSIAHLREERANLAASAEREIGRVVRSLWVAESDRDWAIEAVARVVEERDEARASVATVLVHYGQQAARADAAEQAEVDRLLGGGES